jgi:hypothetical protein
VGKECVCVCVCETRALTRALAGHCGIKYREIVPKGMVGMWTMATEVGVTRARHHLFAPPAVRQQLPSSSTGVASAGGLPGVAPSYSTS